jgi:hypothetical protein
MTELEKITYDLALCGQRLSNVVYNTANSLEGDEAKRLYDLVDAFDKVIMKYVDWKNKR